MDHIREISAMRFHRKKSLCILFASIVLPPIVWISNSSVGGTFIAPAMAQTQRSTVQSDFADPPLSSLAALARQKGDEHVDIGDPCRNFAVKNETGKCPVYQLDYEGSSTLPSFNVIEGTPGETIIIIIRHVLPDATDKSETAQTYLTAVDGKLRAAFSGTMRGSDLRSDWSWSKLSITDPQVKSGFVKEVAFWQEHVKDLNGRPARKP